MYYAHCCHATLYAEHNRDFCTIIPIICVVIMAVVIVVVLCVTCCCCHKCWKSVNCSILPLTQVILTHACCQYGCCYSYSITNSCRKTKIILWGTCMLEVMLVWSDMHVGRDL